MNEFREAVTGFRNAMREEGERNVCPGLQTMLHPARREELPAALGRRRRGDFVNARGRFLFTRREQRQREAAQERSDMLLLEQINAGLSRSVSPAMAPLLGLP